MAPVPGALGAGRELAAAFEPLGVSARGYHVLRAALEGEHTQTELADTVGLDKTTMVVVIDELERAGLAERRLAPHDRRARMIAVTAAGKRKVAEADKVKGASRPRCSVSCRPARARR